MSGRLFHIATALTVPPQRLTVLGREYLTAPVVLLVEGVLNGGYVPADALQPQDWDGMPVVLNHPTAQGGQPISARSPDVLAASGVGQLRRVRLSTGRRRGQPVASLAAELWLDVVQAQAIGGEAVQALEMLESQTPLEVSTGFYSQAERAAGAFHGVPYREIHHAITPDHLALLPNGIGACSWHEGGCGAPRLHHAQACTCHITPEVRMQEQSPYWRRLASMLRLVPQPAGAPLLTVEQTDADVRESLYGCLAREMGVDSTPIFIDAINTQDQTFTYRQGERLLQRSWTLENGVVTLSPDVRDVQRDTTYIPVTPHQEDPPMPPTPAVLASVQAVLAQDGSRWSEADRPQLEAMTEAQLARLAAAPSPSAAAVEKAGKRLAALAALQALPLQPFSSEELSLMSLERLEGLVRYAAQPADYSGQGLAQPRRTAADDEEPYAAPPNTMERVVARQKELGLR
jgi:hypothetical protein